MHLFSLLGSILSTIISQWLTIRDISSLNIGTSETEKRIILLALFESAEFVLQARSSASSSSTIGGNKQVLILLDAGALNSSHGRDGSDTAVEFVSLECSASYTSQISEFITANT